MLYTALFIIALLLNLGSKRNLLIVLLVGFSFYFPTELITNYYWWYATCIFIEFLKIVACYLLLTRLSVPILAMNMFLLSCHGLSLIFDVNIPYYKQVAPYLEHFEILACILFANTSLHYIKGKIRCQLK